MKWRSDYLYKKPMCVEINTVEGRKILSGLPLKFGEEYLLIQFRED